MGNWLWPWFHSNLLLLQGVLGDENLSSSFYFVRWKCGLFVSNWGMGSSSLRYTAYRAAFVLNQTNEKVHGLEKPPLSLENSWIERLRTDNAFALFCLLSSCSVRLFSVAILTFV